MLFSLFLWCSVFTSFHIILGSMWLLMPDLKSGKNTAEEYWWEALKPNLLPSNHSRVALPSVSHNECESGPARLRPMQQRVPEWAAEAEDCPSCPFQLDEAADCSRTHTHTLASFSSSGTHSRVAAYNQLWTFAQKCYTQFSISFTLFKTSLIEHFF